MRRVGDQNHIALCVAIGFVVGAYDEHASELAVRPRGGLQGDGPKAAQRLERLLQFV